jgi:PAS domain S-box-containing protein
MGRLDLAELAPPLTGESLQEIYNTIPSGLLVFDEEGLIQAANVAALALLGCELPELLGQHVSEVFPPDGPFNMSHLKRLSASRSPLRGKRTVRAKSEGLIPALASALPLFDANGELQLVVLSFVEIPKKWSVEDELSHAHQLESVGKITAGIAHEINTPVQFIGDSVTFLQEAFNDLAQLLSTYKQLRDAAEAGSVSSDLIAAVKATEHHTDLGFLEEEIPKSIKRTLDGVSRVAEITRAVKEFTYPDQNEKVAVDLNVALLNTLTVARNEYKYVAELDTDLGDLPPVFCHIGHLNQVFLNLVVNAADAIAVAGDADPQGGKIRIQTRCEGNTVLISVSDTGCGIPDELRERIFEPFFTTKAAGSGTGQGLSIARSTVVEKHFGTIDVETEVGRGTTFLVRLPVDGQTPVCSEKLQ